ncbi:MAG: hypothetical protein M3Y42_17855 [Actinomycetota bacterium]|nr:hypothetical protein [Actinomycetota bacterium]MDQ2958810.1 hypothetical protein [Actinomycetota bacterium]
MRQRWYFTIAGLLVTLVLCGLASTAVAVKYEAKAQILVLPPKTTVGNGGNPYLALGGLQAAADVLARAMSDAQTYAKLRGEGITGTYTVARDLTTSGPVLLVAADNSTPALALATLRGILAQAAPRLTDLQDALTVPDSTRLTSNVFTQDNAAAAQRKSQIRAILVAFAAGIFATVLLVSAGDSMLTRRSRRRARPVSSTSVEDATSVAISGGVEATQSPRRAAPRSAAPKPTKSRRGRGRGEDSTGQQRTDPLQDLMDEKPESADGSEWSTVTTEHAGRPGHG